MRGEQLHSLAAWFNSYVKKFYSKDQKIQAGIELKEKHTARVRENIVRIGRSLNLKENDLLQAETIALFHDIGRFKQYVIYQTFNDRRSENHALLGVRELLQGEVLSVLTEEETDLVLKAVEYHNLLDLPWDAPERHLFFSRLIRDADKLDILKITTDHYRNQGRGSNPALESGLPDTPGYSRVLVEDLLHQRRCGYDDVKNLNDRKLLLLSWLYDINFPYTLSEIAAKNVVGKLIAVLPDTGDVRMVYEYLQVYMTKNLTFPAGAIKLAAARRDKYFLKL